MAILWLWILLARLLQTVEADFKVDDHKKPNTQDENNIALKFAWYVNYSHEYSKPLASAFKSCFEALHFGALNVTNY